MTERLAVQANNSEIARCTADTLALSELIASKVKANGDAWRDTSEGRALNDAAVSSLKAASTCAGPANKRLHDVISGLSRDKIEQSLFELGYEVVGKTRIRGHYFGCGSMASAGLLFLEDGELFHCNEGSPTSKYSSYPGEENPEAVLLKQVNSGALVLLVGNIAYEGAIIARSH